RRRGWWPSSRALAEEGRWSSPGAARRRRRAAEFPGRSTSPGARRQPGALSPARRRGWWRSSKRLDADEGMGDATGLGVTQRGGSWSRARTRRSPAEGLVFYKLPLSKTRKWDKSDIVESLAEEAPPLSGHGP